MPGSLIAIVEDHRLQRVALGQILGAEPDLTVEHSCETLPALVDWLRLQPNDRIPDLVVLDLMVDRGADASTDTVRWLVRSGVRVLVLSALASPVLVREMLQAGVAGVVGKRESEATILEAVRAVLANGEWMTAEAADVIAGDVNRPELAPQEERALVLYASGLRLAEVAEAIGVQPNTAKKYLDRVKAKYTAAGRPVHTKIDLLHVVDEDGYPGIGAQGANGGGSSSPRRGR